MTDTKQATTDYYFLSLLADIRAAAGDPEGKLMQDELVEHITGMAQDAERYLVLKELFSPMSLDINGNHSWICRGSPLRGPSLKEAVDRVILAATKADR